MLGLPVPNAKSGSGSATLLPIQAGQRLGRGAGAAERVDVESAPPRVKRLHMQKPRQATLRDVAKHALNALLMKLLVLAIGDYVLQQ